MPVLHPPSSAVRVEVPETSVDRYLSQGWREADVSAPDESADDGAPPKAGRGSGRDVWVAYAERLDVAVSDDMTRDDIIAAVEG
jgi:hypothetical protein